MFQCRETAVVNCLNNQMSSVENVSRWSVKGRFLSKNPGACLASKTRAIMPMPCSLALVDAILAVRCGRFLKGLDSPDPCFLECALKGRSITDVVFAARMAVEKGLDDHSRCAIAEGDIERY